MYLQEMTKNWFVPALRNKLPKPDIAGWNNLALRAVGSRLPGLPLTQYAQQFRH